MAKPCGAGRSTELLRADGAWAGQAGQAVEPAALVPLQMLAPRGCAVLVGDPQQLPATVISRAAQQAGLPLSLFQRLQQVHPPDNPLTRL